MKFGDNQRNIAVGGKTVYGGTVGVIFDGRDRPISIPSDPLKRLEALRSWSSALNEYPE